MYDPSNLEVYDSMDSQGIVRPPRPRRRLIALVCILSISVLAATSAMVYIVVRHEIRTRVSDEPSHSGVYSGGASAQVAAQTTKFTFEDVFSDEFKTKSFTFSWYGDVLLYKDANGDYRLYDPSSGTDPILNTEEQLNELHGTKSFPSADTHYLLVAYDTEEVWRHSFTARYVIYDSKAADNNTKIIQFPKYEGLTGEQLQYANWAPSGHALTFVYGNDVYYQADPQSEAVRITSSGHPVFYFNGIPDWLYEEDVLSSRSATYWSQESRYICFGAFNDTDVKFVRYQVYGDSANTYSTLREIAYPMAGYLTEDGEPGPNSKAELYILDTTNLSLAPQKLEPPAEFTDIDHYFTRVSWQDDSHVLVTWVNRVQNHAIIMTCAAATLQCTKHYEQQLSNGWISAPWRKPHWLPDRGSYLTVLPRPVGVSGTWKHVAHVTAPISGPGTVTFLTDGEEEVLSVAAYDEERKLVYYLTTNGDPKSRHLFRLGTSEAAEEVQQPSCLSCSVHACDYAQAHFSESASYYLLHCMGPDVPSYRLYNTINDTVLVMEDNAAFRAHIADKDLPDRQFMEVDLGDGYKGWAELFVPTGYAENKTTYPLFIYTYGGPESQLVTKRYSLGSTRANWLQHAVSSMGVVLASVDGRGTTGKGDSYMYEMYKGMATVEVDDQITAATYLKSLDFVDSNKNAAIFGWSYGGQNTAHVMGRDSDVIKCGLSVAPVSNQRYYDTAYTERYMSLATEDDNAVGYNRTDVMQHVENFRGKHFLLAHGTDDDNVHFRHSALLIKALTEAQIQFRTLLYVDEDHSISSTNQNRHLYRSMTNFLSEECWAPGSDVTPTEPPSAGSAIHFYLYTIILAVVVSLNIC